MSGDLVVALIIIGLALAVVAELDVAKTRKRYMKATLQKEDTQ